MIVSIKEMKNVINRLELILNIYFANQMVEDEIYNAEIHFHDECKKYTIALHNGILYAKDDNNSDENKYNMKPVDVVFKLYIANYLSQRFGKLIKIEKSIFDEESIKKIKALKELDFSEVIQLQGTPDGYFYLFFQTVDFNYNVHYNLKIKGNDDVYNFFDKSEKNPIKQFLEDGGFQFGGFRIPTEDLINANRDINIIYQNNKEE